MGTAIELPRMATITQAAAESGLAVYRVRRLCKQGLIRSVPCGRRVLVNLTSLAAYLNGEALTAATNALPVGIRRADAGGAR